MKNETILQYFIKGLNAKTGLRNITNGYYTYKGRTLRTQNGILINYNTIIALKKNGIIYITSAYYSNTTTRIINRLKKLINNKYIEVSQDRINKLASFTGVNYEN